MRTVWIVWGDDSRGRFIAGIYDDKVRAEADLRMAQEQPDVSVCYHIQEKEITK